MLRAARQAARLWCARRSAHTAAGDEVVLRFSCTACGRCCKHDGARAVLVSADEVAAIARHAAAPPAQFVRRLPEEGQHALQSRSDGACVFLTPAKRCGVYEARPTQCRAYPFWAETTSPLGWLRESARCEGIALTAASGVPPTPRAEIVMNVVLADVALSGESSTYDADRANLELLPDEVSSHFAELQADSAASVRLDTDTLCVVDSADEAGRMTRTMVLKSAPALDQSAAFLDADGDVVRDELVLPVHRALALALLQLPAERPLSVLVIGGGGCSLPLALTCVVPIARITVVELSAAVADVARVLFIGDAQIDVVVADGAAFMKSGSNTWYDFIVVDAAASADAAPAPELATPEFVALTAQHLAADGVLAVNCFGSAATASFEAVAARAFPGGATALEVPCAGGEASGAHTVVFAKRSSAHDAADALRTWRRVLMQQPEHAAARIVGADMLQHAAQGMRLCR